MDLHHLMRIPPVRYRRSSTRIRTVAAFKGREKSALGEKTGKLGSMPPPHKSAVLATICEHNSLNGLRFVAGEFLLVAAVAAWIGVGAALHHRAATAVAGFGVAMNGIAIVAIAVAQLRAHDINLGILKAWSAQNRAWIARDYPDLNRHTILIVVFVLIPFLLVILLAMEIGTGNPAK